MKKITNFNVSTSLLTLILLLLIFTRLIPHPPNVTPIAAVALLGGIYFSNRVISFIIPLILLLRTPSRPGPDTEQRPSFLIQ